MVPTSEGKVNFVKHKIQFLAPLLLSKYGRRDSFKTEEKMAGYRLCKNFSEICFKESPSAPGGQSLLVGDGGVRHFLGLRNVEYAI